jgi:hypothetical protein
MLVMFNEFLHNKLCVGDKAQVSAFGNGVASGYIIYHGRGNHLLSLKNIHLANGNKLSCHSKVSFLVLNVLYPPIRSPKCSNTQKETEVYSKYVQYSSNRQCHDLSNVQDRVAGPSSSRVGMMS